MADDTINPKKTGDNIKQNVVLAPSSSKEASRAQPPAAPVRTPSLRQGYMQSPSPTHRQSFNEGLRHPPSPRVGRQPSLSHVGAQDLWNNPPRTGSPDPVFVGRDWQGIGAGELVVAEDVRFADLDTTVEKVTDILIHSPSSVVLVRVDSSEKSAVGTFDYKDLNRFLLFATSNLHTDDAQRPYVQELARKAQQGHKVIVKELKALGAQEELVTLPHDARLTKAVKAFGGGVHRIVTVKEPNNEVTGILSQLHLVKFLWENGSSFPVLDRLYPCTIKDLGVWSQTVISINGDKPLEEALMLMDNEGISSIAVVDDQNNVIGNISTVDTKLITKESDAPLLKNTCIHFISVILSTRGMDEGKDPFPVFYVTPYTTLAHTVAKLVATKSHRMWVVNSSSPYDSGPPTPAAQQSVVYPPHQAPTTPQAIPSFTPHSATPSVSASALPGSSMSGHLCGVVSLTDILNLFARVSGLHPDDPNETRRHRRRSSSISLVRGSLDSARSSNMDLTQR